MNERNKKVYAIVIAVLLVLSIATSFIPSIQVKADEQISIPISDLSFFDKVQSVSDVFTLELYNQGLQDNTSLSDSIKYNTASASTIFANDNTNLITQTNTILGYFNNHNLTFNDYGSDSQTKTDLHDFISNPDDFYTYYIFGNSPASNDPVLYIFYSRSEINGCVVNGSYGTYYIKETSASPVYRLTLNGIDSDQAKDFRDVVVYNASDVPTKVLDNIFISYSSFPIYFSYYERGYTGDTYTDYDSPSKVVNAVLVNNDTSDFLIDRRTLFSNFVPDNPNYNVNNDPISKEYKGAWDIDLVPVDDLLDGSIKVKFVPTQKLSTDNPNYSVKYYFGFFFNGKKFNYNSLVDRPLMNVGMSQVIYGNANAGNFKSIELNNYYNITDTDGISVNSVSDDYISLPTSTVLRGLTPVGSYTLQGALVGGNLGQNSNPINVYQSLAFYKSQNMFNQNNGGNNIGGTFGSISVGLSSNQGGLTSAKLIVQAQAFYNGSEASNVATVTYNYLTGEITKQGTVSTDNNTPVDSTTGIPDGITPQEQQAIDSSTQNIVTNGGSISGGNSTNQNTNNPTFTNNNNPSITINNNNGLTEPDGVPENPEEGSFSMLWSIWESYHFAEWLNQDLEGNGFLHYIFSSEIWNLPIFNLIIPALAILITVSIASTIIRFIRGN